MQSPPYGPPVQQRPTPQKSSNFIPIVLGVACLVFGACGISIGYAFYRASTPEGKKEAKELDDKTNTTLDDFVVKMAHVRSQLPALDDPPVACPAGTKTVLAPVVDTFFFDALQDGRTDAARVARQNGAGALRDDTYFSDSVLDAELARAGIDAGPMIFKTSFATSNIEQLATKPIVLVIDVDAFTPPTTDASGFVGGQLDGALDVVDWATDKTICHAPISAKSSDSINYGGGMQLKFHGIPSPTIGKTDLDDAVEKDFEKNVKAATKTALASMGVP